MGKRKAENGNETKASKPKMEKDIAISSHTIQVLSNTCDN